jgi:D-3-phosphoglycerate dehydrogenase
MIELADRLGSFAGQLTTTPIRRVRITYEGAVAHLKTRALTASALAGLLRPALSQINVVSAPAIARERAIVVEETTREAESDYESLITLSVTTDAQERAVAGTVFTDGKPRIVAIKDIKVEAEFGACMLYVTNEDKPGFIGRFATTLGNAGVNIATFALGRDTPGGSAIALVEVDGEVPGEAMQQIKTIAGVKAATVLRF